MTEYTKKQAVAIIVDCAEKYRDHLNGNTILYILRDKHQRISAFEVSFHPYNFLHLTGKKVKAPHECYRFLRKMSESQIKC